MSTLTGQIVLALAMTVRKRLQGVRAIHTTNSDAAMLAGLGDRREQGGEVIGSCSIVIGEANKAISSFHDRMPFVLNPYHYDTWLDCAVTNADQVMKLLEPVPENALDFYPVSTRVSSAKNQGTELIEPIGHVVK